jgi:predicted GNAT superfamily acetyltransferase
MGPDQIILRDLRTHNEYEQCVSLQRATWGEDFREVVPPAMLMIAQKVGGVLAGAFDPADRLDGFVFGITGFDGSVPVHWSHMLAVRADLRDRGIGRRLKLYQRDRLRRMGVERMYWSFDPLVARNAHFNLDRLRVRVVEYVPDMYGDDPMSRLDSVIGTDRFVVEWLLGSAAEAAPPASVSSAAPIVTADVTGNRDARQPDLPQDDEVRVEIPRDIHALKQESPEVAAAWRKTTRRALLHYLGRGYAVHGLTEARKGARLFYVVRRVTS